MQNGSLFNGSLFLLLHVASLLFDFVFTKPDCGNCHTAIRITVLDLLQIVYKTSKTLPCFLYMIVRVQDMNEQKLLF